MDDPGWKGYRVAEEGWIDMSRWQWNDSEGYAIRMMKLEVETRERDLVAAKGWEGYVKVRKAQAEVFRRNQERRERRGKEAS